MWICTHSLLENEELVTDKILSLEFRKRLLKCCTTTYYTRAFNYTKSFEEMWFYSRMLKIPRIARVRSDTLLNTMEKARKLSSTTEGREIRSFEQHIIRGERYYKNYSGPFCTKILKEQKEGLVAQHSRGYRENRLAEQLLWRD